MLNEYENLSEGIKDGFIVLFCKDGKIRPILLSKDEANLLNISLSIPFQNKEVVLGKGNVNIENGILKETTSDVKNKYLISYQYLTYAPGLEGLRECADTFEEEITLECSEVEIKDEYFVERKIHEKTKKEISKIFTIAKI